MASKTLFSSASSRGPETDTVNRAGGRAYKLENKHALAQLAATGCLSDTFYADARTQLAEVVDLCQAVDPKFIAKVALYSRKKGYMKDMPAILCAYLSTVDTHLLREVFNKVIDNPKMLRNFVQIMRSGAVGRKSLGTAPKNLILNWLANQDDDDIFRASVGNDPSMVDIIKMVHPRPATKKREALYAYMLGRKYNARNLPALVKTYEKFKTSDNIEKVPNVPFQMLTSWDLDNSVWEEIIKNAGWHMIRMNLNTFERNKIFENKKMIKLVVDKLRDENLIKRSRVFPYQLLAAYMAYDGRHEIQEALQDAMEIAVSNVPKIDGQVLLFPDVSGSMHSAVTGNRKGATSAVRCVDVAALVSSVFLRENKSAVVIPFSTRAHTERLNPRDSIMTNATRLAKFCGGGTDCSAPLSFANTQKMNADLCIYISDNESWFSTNNRTYHWGAQSRTDTMSEWKKFKSRNKKAKMVCLDINPEPSTQAKENNDILNIGGFSDVVFDIIAEFYNGKLNVNHWVGLIDELAV